MDFIYTIAGTFFGIVVAFYIISGQLKKSNEIGNSKGDRLTYMRSFDILNAKNKVGPFLDIDKM